MEQREVKLKACPFCGDDDVYVAGDYTPPNDHDAGACQTCLAVGPLKGAVPAAIAAWNKRVPDPLVQQMAQALEWCAKHLDKIAREQYPDSEDSTRLFSSANNARAALKAWQESQQ